MLRHFLKCVVCGVVLASAATAPVELFSGVINPREHSESAKLSALLEREAKRPAVKGVWLTSIDPDKSSFLNTEVLFNILPGKNIRVSLAPTASQKIGRDIQERWEGRLPDHPGGRAEISVFKGKVYAQLFLDTMNYSIRPIPGGLTLVTQYDPRELPPEESDSKHEAGFRKGGEP